MKSQSVVISSYLAVILVVIVLFFVFINFISLTGTSTTQYIYLDIERVIQSRINWTAKDLLHIIALNYSPEYINVTIIVYDILHNNEIVFFDNATYMSYNVNLNDLVIHRFVYMNLERNGYHREIIVEVGFK